MNRYAFVQGNPVSMIDPFGLCAEPGSSSSSSGFSWASVQKGFENAWGGVKDYFGSWSVADWGHTTLDAAGMIPVFGIVFDGANGIWYLAAGDTLNAGLSGAACIPVVGEFATGGKLTVRATSKAISMTARHADEAAEVAEFVIKNSDEVVEGTIGTVSRGKLSDYLGVPEYSNNGKFYSVENANGGKVYVSNDPIDQSHFEDIPYFEDGNVNILSGVHGDEFGNLHFDDDAIEFFNQDVNRFKNMSNVNVYDMSKMEGASIYEMINSGDTTILGWCWSENYSLARTVKPKN